MDFILHLCILKDLEGNPNTSCTKSIIKMFPLLRFFPIPSVALYFSPSTSYTYFSLFPGYTTFFSHLPSSLLYNRFSLYDINHFRKVCSRKRMGLEMKRSIISQGLQHVFLFCLLAQITELIQLRPVARL